MSSSSGAGRLRREYKTLQQQPLPYVAVRPDGDNLFLWYFLVHSLPKDTPYFGGFYLGKLEMPPRYPFEPPSITMITPSGRFETDMKVCTSFTSYHRETWSPLWRIETLLMGFVSFMLDENARFSRGSMETSWEHRRMVALHSPDACLSHPKLKRLFPDFVEAPLELD